WVTGFLIFLRVTEERKHVVALDRVFLPDHRLKLSRIYLGNGPISNLQCFRACQHGILRLCEIGEHGILKVCLNAQASKKTRSNSPVACWTPSYPTPSRPRISRPRTPQRSP